MNTFEWHGETLHLEDFPYNATMTNERAVELAIARWFVEGMDGQGLEVGAVLGHYFETPPRRVVDRYDESMNVANLDVFAIDGAYDWIVSISTIEHVRMREPSAADNRALQ